MPAPNPATTPEKAHGASTRTAVFATVGIVVLLLLAVCVAASWPEIELRYHRHYFWHGTQKRQVKELRWICEHRLEKGMTKAEVERILGESLEDRFARVPKEGSPAESVGYGFGPVVATLSTEHGKTELRLVCLVFCGRVFQRLETPFRFSLWDDDE